MFQGLMEHQQKLQMQTVMNASRDALNAEIRVPRSPTLAEPPDDAIQARHRLTHVLYEPWCQSCVALFFVRARCTRGPVGNRTTTGNLSATQGASLRGSPCKRQMPITEMAWLQKVFAQ